MAFNLNVQSPLGRLAPSDVHKLNIYLTVNENWKQLAGNIYRHNGNPRFTWLEIEAMSIQEKQPSRALIVCLMTEGYKIGQLIQVLADTQLYLAADYLAVEVLGGDPVPRGPPNQGNPPHSPVENNPVNFPPPVHAARQAPPPNYGPPQATPPNYRAPQATPLNYGPPQATPPYYRSPQTTPPNYRSQQTTPPNYPGPASPEPLSYHLHHQSGFHGNQGQCQSEAPPRNHHGDVDTSRGMYGPPSGPSTYTHSHLLDAGDTSQYSMLAKLTNQFDDCPKQDGGHFIGKGGSSVVYYAREESGREVAIKRFPADKGHSDDQFKNELKLLPKLQHAGIVPLLSHAVSTHYKCLVYPYMSNGSLYDRLACKDNSKPLTIQERLRIVLNVAQALKYLHSQGLVHRDMKSSNILLDHHMNARVADFGVARQSIQLVDEQASSTMVVVGSYGYMAPEITNHVISAKLDVFSFGVILLEILTALKPFDTKREGEEQALYKYVPSDVDELRELNYVDTQAGTWDSETLSTMFTLARRCLKRSPDSRPSMDEIVEKLGESNA